MIWLISTPPFSTLCTPHTCCSSHTALSASWIRCVSCTFGTACLLFMSLPYIYVSSALYHVFIGTLWLSISKHSKHSPFIIFIKDDYLLWKGWQMSLGENSWFIQQPFPWVSHQKYSSRCCSRLDRICSWNTCSELISQFALDHQQCGHELS